MAEGRGKLNPSTQPAIPDCCNKSLPVFHQYSIPWTHRGVIDLQIYGSVPAERLTENSTGSRLTDLSDAYVFQS